MLKIILVMFFSIVCFGATRYVTPNMVVQNSELYCINSDKILVYSIGDIVDGDFAQSCSYNKDSVERRLQKIHEYNDSFTGNLISLLISILITAVFALMIFAIILLYGIIKSIIKD